MQVNVYCILTNVSKQVFYIFSSLYELIISTIIKLIANVGLSDVPVQEQLANYTDIYISYMNLHTCLINYAKFCDKSKFILCSQVLF